ncbi:MULTISPECIES: BamA/TamA family outer membrane protein [Prosthecochloris]|nr:MULTISPECIES: BamA/TamA family outer membrane protein [Prosthecochloris]
MNKRIRFIATLLASVVLMLMLPEPVMSRTKPDATASTDNGFVNNIVISGNRAISTEEIRSVMSTKENTRYFGVFKPWVGIHRFADHLFNDPRGAYTHKTLLSSQNNVKKWMQESLGEAPIAFVSDDFRRDIALIKKLYTYKGYFFAIIDTTIRASDNGAQQNIFISIEENTPTRIDTISYQGLDNLDTAATSLYLKQSKLKVQDIFSVDNLLEERDRSINFFKEYGYALMHEDSISIQIDTVGVLAGVKVDLRLPQKLEYGPVKAVLHDPRKPDDPNAMRAFSLDNVDVTVYGNPRISDKLVTNYTAYRPGQLTQQSLQQKTLQNLGSTNIFSSIFIRRDSVQNGKLYTSIHLEPKPRHLIEPSIYADNRYGNLFLGTSLGYENRNLLKNAENLKIKGDFGMQLGTSNDLLSNLEDGQYEKYRAYELGLSASLVMPELKKPGSAYEATLEYNRSRLPILLDNQTGLLRASYNTSLNPRSRLNIDFFELEWVQKDSLNGFKQLFKTDLADNIGIDPTSSMDVDNALDSLLETNINQTFRVQYYSSNRKDPYRTTTHTWNAAVEAVGSLAWLIDEYIDTGSYAGYSDDDPQIFGTSYSQFFKISTQYSFTRKLSENTEVAGRVFAGWMAPYGKADDTPEERRFFAGGPNSMRGWLFNTLGPASNDNEVAANLGADIRLEGNLEYRIKFFKVFGQPSGIAVFTDLGNIWDRSGTYGLTFNSLYEDIAWDMGVGLRIGSPIGPFRFDFAYKLYDPSQKPEPWQLSNWTPGDYTFNFGIGEPF